MAARLRKKSRSANYAISVDPLELKRNSPCFIGKLRCILSYVHLVVLSSSKILLWTLLGVGIM